MIFNTKTVHEVDYNDLDEAINLFLKSKGAKKCDFEIVAHHELSNDVFKTFSVGQDDILKETTKQDILEGRLHWRAGKILNWMFEDGLIPEGEYLVKISW